MSIKYYMCVCVFVGLYSCLSYPAPKARVFFMQYYIALYVCACVFVGLYSCLSYPAPKARVFFMQYYIAVCCLFGCTIFFDLI